MREKGAKKEGEEGTRVLEEDIQQPPGLMRRRANVMIESYCREPMQLVASPQEDDLQWVDKFGEHGEDWGDEGKLPMPDETALFGSL